MKTKILSCLAFVLTITGYLPAHTTFEFHNRESEFKTDCFRVNARFVRNYSEFAKSILNKTSGLQAELGIEGYKYVIGLKKDAVLTVARYCTSTLNKCAAQTVLEEELLALNDIVFQESLYLDREWQKTLYDIQQIIYDKETGKFIGITSREAAKQIKKISDRFSSKVSRWKEKNALIESDCKSEGFTSRPFIAAWNNKIKSHHYNRDLFEVARLCKTKNVSNLEQARKIADKYKQNKYATSKEHNDYMRMFCIWQRASKELASKNALQVQNVKAKVSSSANINKVQSVDSATDTALKDVLKSEEFLKNQLPKNITSSMEVLEKDAEFWLEHASSDSRLFNLAQALKESLESPIFRTKNYKLTNEGIALLRKLGIAEKSFTHFFGNQFQHALHAEFVSVVNKAGVVCSGRTYSEIRELSEDIARFSNVGVIYLQTGHAGEAVIMNDLCWSLLNCGVAVGDKLYDTTLDPIEIESRLDEAIEHAGDNLAVLLNHLGLDDIKILEQHFPQLNPEMEEAFRVFEEFLVRDAERITQELATAELTGFIGGKFLGPVAGRFFKRAQDKIIRMARYLAKGGKDAAEVLAEHVPVDVRIAGRATKNLMENAGKGVGQKIAKAIEWTPYKHKHFPPKNKSWKEIVQLTKILPAKYKPGIDIEKLERYAWEHGTPVTNGKPFKVFKCDKIIGAKNGIETQYLRVEMSANTIHGHPIPYSEYKHLLREI